MNDILELQSLSKISMRIPTFVQSGETADLTCSYYLDSNQLYSIKWYKVGWPSATRQYQLV